VFMDRWPLPLVLIEKILIFRRTIASFDLNTFPDVRLLSIRCLAWNHREGQRQGRYIPPLAIGFSAERVPIVHIHVPDLAGSTHQIQQ
jgi:hypothetical protein